MVYLIILMWKLKRGELYDLNLFRQSQQIRNPNHANFRALECHRSRQLSCILDLTVSIQDMDWMTYTLYSDNEPRVAEVAKVDLNEYDKVSNPVSGKNINLQMSEISNRLSSGLIIF